MYKIIVIGGSAGSFPLILKLLEALPKTFNTPIVMCLHRLKHVKHGFVEALNLKSTIKVTEPLDKESIKPGKIYLAPPNYHIMVELSKTFAFSTDEDVKFSRPSIDVAFDSFSYVYKDKMLGIILSGANSDGAAGAYRAHKRGAKIITQTPEDALIKTMPDATIKLIPDVCQLTFEKIIKEIINSDTPNDKHTK